MQDRYPVQRFVIGVRRSRPNAFGRSFTPGGACRRLYSAPSIIAIARATPAGWKPAARSSPGAGCGSEAVGDELLARAVELDVRLQHRVELRVRPQGLLVKLIGAELGG